MSRRKSTVSTSNSQAAGLFQRKLAALLGNTKPLASGELSSLFDNLIYDDDLDLLDEDPESIVEDWADAFEDLYSAAPSEFIHDKRKFSFVVNQVFQDGEFHGTCTDGGTKYPVFARIYHDEVPAACSCPKSRGKDPCVHVVKFVQYLARELADTSSALHRRVIEEKFTPGKPNMALYESSPIEAFFHDFDNEWERAEIDGDAAAEHDTVALSSTNQNRLAWRVERANGEFELYPVVQQPKKRGRGFTKGRRIKFDTAQRDHELSRSLQDERALSCVRYEESYYSYRGEMVIDVYGAIDALVGAKNVFMDTDPVEVRRDSYEFEILEQDDFYICLPHLASNDEAAKDRVRNERLERSRGNIQSPSARIITTDRKSSFLDINFDEHVVSLVECDPDDFRFVMMLLQMQAIPTSHGDKLFERVEKIQSRLSIRLPEQSSGPLVDVSSRPVVLMRSNADGSLDLALRVRDHAGRLRVPGAAPVVSIGEQDGRQVQFRRNIAEELQHAEQLSGALRFEALPGDDGIASEQFAGHLTDFGDILNMIDLLQSWASEEEQGRSLGRAFDGIPVPEVLWDRNSEKPLSVLGSISSNNVRVEINRKRDWFGISGQCDVGGKQIALSELLQNLTNDDVDHLHGDFVKLKDGQWARIGEKLRNRLRRLRDATHADRKTMKVDATAAPAIREFLDEGEIQYKAVKAWNQCLERLARAEKLEPKVPEGLDANLRDYQLDGFRWLRRLAEWGVGGVLADDMGLGKTLQTLAVLLDRKDEGPALVIAPTSVAFNWVREAERFAPALSAHMYRETDRAEFLKSVAAGDLVICSYGLALRDAEAIAGVEWGSVVLDEAQAIKNSRSKTSKAIATIPSKWTIALTGTPVENHLGELWSLFHVVSPGVFGGWEQFRKRFATPIEKENNEAARLGLAERLKPFVLRRKKSEVLKDLPPRTEMNLYVDLSKEEREEYERVRLEAIGEVDQIESLVKTQDQRFRILALITRLRQISCNAKLVNGSFEGEAAKLVQLRETLTNLKEEGHRALIFSQFTEHLALIRSELDDAGFTYEYLDGSTPAQARQDRVDAFQNGTADAFLISLKAGGTGLNLTAADYVIHMDPWWNPAVEDQATDRAHRIGQQKPVMVYRIIARGTIEEEILSLHESKRDLVAGVMEGTAAAAKLSNDELIGMLRNG